ncbi:MAG: glycoside hydrolase family 130 protein [Phycisphaeraceae bacterium]|nr:MAG: glycoside hydrolase family 130 protein [Phycisphaeraceae bacterium]
MPLTRDIGNPIVTRGDVPAVRGDLVDVTSVFNPGACVWRGRELLLLRVQTRGRGTVLVPAERLADGSVRVEARVVEIEGLAETGVRVHHLYDPRLTVIGEAIYAVLAADLDDACRLVVARSEDWARWSLVSMDRAGDRRNGVLFPEKIAGRFARLERPNRVTRTGGPASGSVITLAVSDDLAAWEDAGEVMSGRARLWDELIGAGPPPVKTREGWLLIYHGVATHFASCNIYQAGVCLLDLEDPTKVVARAGLNVLEPREMWELVGQVPNVVFPSGMVVDGVDADGFAGADCAVRVYYGAADTVVGLAISTVGELIADCRAGAGA